MKPETTILSRVFRRKESEVVTLLRSIDSRLAKLESCVRPGIRHKDCISHIVTGHWND